MSAAPAVVTALLLGLLVSGCTADRGAEGGDGATPSGAAAATPGGAAPLAALDPEVSMTEAGAALYAASTPQEEPRPRYDTTVRVDPATGEVDGTLEAVLPAGAEQALRFRVFAGLPALEAGARVEDVTVDGEPAEADLDASVLTVPLPEDRREPVTVRMSFRYTVPERPESSGGLLDGLLGSLGDGLDVAEIGLLSRTADAVQLGHAVPLWIPEGRSADPVPEGYGDIGGFAAADATVSVEVPEGWEVVDSGVRTGSTTRAGRTTVTSEATGMRDLAISVLRDHVTETRALDGPLDGVTVTATAPATQAEQLEGVLDETEEALRTLSDALGPYPWREFDVVSVPLGSSVGGMEWPGATWIESGLFGGGLPGLGDLEGLGVDGSALEGLLREFGGPEAEDLVRLLATTRRWTIAHEVAHSWWTVVVGNDSAAAPAVDEPLAQHASCLVVRESLPDGEQVCRTQIESGYEQMRMLGEADAPADRPTDQFDSSLQYGGVVYGKAAALYLTLEEEFGVEEVTAALRTLVEEHAFQSVDGGDVRDLLVRELGPEAGPLWQRWMEETHGDADLGVG
jgi:hypothetical protein